MDFHIPVLALLVRGNFCALFRLPGGEKVSCNILVIEESSPSLRGRIVSVLTKEGFKVATAASLGEMLLRWDGLKPQLIILGEGLTIDSFEACSRLRQTVDVPILMVGAVPGGEVWTRVVEVGADFYLAKPFSYLELVVRVRALLRRYERKPEP